MQRTDGADKMFETFVDVFLNLAEDFGLSEKTRSALRDLLREGTGTDEDGEKESEEKIIHLNVTYTLKGSISGPASELDSEDKVMHHLIAQTTEGRARVMVETEEVDPRDLWFR